MYPNPLANLTTSTQENNTPQVNEGELQDSFDHFYEGAFTELSKFGEVEELIVCANLGQHMVGNVFVKFSTEIGAQRAMVSLTVSRFYYAGRHLTTELSQVTDFKQARCRLFDETGECPRGGITPVRSWATVTSYTSSTPAKHCSRDCL
eukprot:TRINITY_DN3264_c0_g2_i1.p1 TRINITY_DN3264_c0_g2~~TRINITY_DN3264_c0_g2_i1.p1  ORF type:complete len:149 (-),score=22.42 TRINITY_DN3264_c0_g2_i1:176-622(-)